MLDSVILHWLHGSIHIWEEQENFFTKGSIVCYAFWKNVKGTKLENGITFILKSLLPSVHIFFTLEKKNILVPSAFTSTIVTFRFQQLMPQKKMNHNNTTNFLIVCQPSLHCILFNVLRLLKDCKISIFRKFHHFIWYKTFPSQKFLQIWTSLKFGGIQIWRIKWMFQYFVLQSPNFPVTKTWTGALLWRQLLFVYNPGLVSGWFLQTCQEEWDLKCARPTAFQLAPVYITNV